MKWHPIWGLLLSAALLVSCATARKKGNRAFREGEYDRALDEYEKVIDKGTKDWKVYFRAAQAATRVGSFSAAERYYGRAIRNGGGTKVARSFAEFYLKTSNYSKAVRLLQFLLDSGAEKQPIYNNLGTALMYAGAPIDAESYLLIAQQMDPKDPIPYINLGVLYERYLHRPKLSLGFYRCYMKMTGDRAQRERVQSRVADLESRYRGVSTGVECGEPFKPQSGGDPGKLRAQLEELKAREEGGGEGARRNRPGRADRRGKRAGKERPIDLEFEGMEGGGDASPREESERADAGVRARGDAGAGLQGDVEEDLVIERGGERPPRSVRDAGGGAKSERRARRMERARRAWKDEEYETVVDAISGLPVASMSVDAMRMYGVSLAELGRNEEASRWLEWVADRKPDPDSVATLLEVYRRLEQSKRLRALCRDFRDRDDYEEATEDCPEPEPREELDNEEKLRRLRQKLKRKRNK